MKTLNPTFFLLVFSSVNISFAQDSINSDAELSAQLVGTWEHVSSTYPSGDVSTYQRKFQFYVDGTGVCARYTDLDTVLIHLNGQLKTVSFHCLKFVKMEKAFMQIRKLSLL
ncbi:MAG: hypothetical protein IPH24_11425 [Crocinitomicaceae bacterium]|nr:hypothetical protein [Crocinitomicaceae bacterium]